jgi:hypothetical protein
MHVLLTILGGVLLLGVFLLFGRQWTVGASLVGPAALVFIPVWLVVAVVNLWVGVSHAGYPLQDELPILLVVFAVPAILAGIVFWQVSPA